MFSIRSLLVVLALSLSMAFAGCSGGEDAPADAGGEAAADTAPEAAPAAASGADAMKGTWGIKMGDEDKAQLDAAKAGLEANPEDAMAKAMVEMMEAMLTSMALEVTGDMMIMAMGEEKEEASYTATAEGDSIKVETTDAEGKKETMMVKVDGNVMTWTKEGEEKPLQWQKK